MLPKIIKLNVFDESSQLLELNILPTVIKYNTAIGNFMSNF